MAGLFSALGGKWTTSRNLAGSITDAVVKKLDKSVRACATAITPLPGGNVGHFADFEKTQDAAHPNLPSLHHLAHMYGARLPGVLAVGDTTTVGPGGDIAAQVTFSIREEMALTLADVVMRRTGIGQFGSPPPATLQAAAAIMAKELGWDAKTQSAETDSLAPCLGTTA